MALLFQVGRQVGVWERKGRPRPPQVTGHQSGGRALRLHSPLLRVAVRDGVNPGIDLIPSEQTAGVADTNTFQLKRFFNPVFSGPFFCCGY